MEMIMPPMPMPQITVVETVLAVDVPTAIVLVVAVLLGYALGRMK
jgi:hypothetical protein